MDVLFPPRVPPEVSLPFGEIAEACSGMLDGIHGKNEEGIQSPLRMLLPKQIFSG